MTGHLSSYVLREYTPKSGKIRKIYIKDDYSFKQLLRYLAKSKKARVGESQKWVDVQRLEHINDLCHAIGV